MRGIEGLREKNKTYEGSSQSLKSFGNLDSQMVLNERPLTPNRTTRGQVDPTQVRGWNLVTNDVPILDKVMGKDQISVFTSIGEIDPTRFYPREHLGKN